jgi:putrescine transport system substrate-binding protein
MTSVSFRVSLLAAASLLLLSACGQKPAESVAPTTNAPQTTPVAGTAGAESPAATLDTDEEKVVNMYNWSDYIDLAVLADFTKETGIKINYDVYDSNETLETKLLAGNTGYDIVVPSSPFLQRQIQAGVYQPLDKSRLTNLKNMDPELMARAAAFDPGNTHAINYLWGTDGVGYNEDKILAIMPDAPVNSYDIFYKPEIVSKFKSCGVTILDAPSEVVGTVLLWMGRDPNSETPEDLAAAEKVLMSIRPFVRYVNSSKYIEDLANGEICLALGWNGDVLQARDRANEAKKGFKIKYNIPKEGSIAFFDMMAIPKDAKHVKNAHILINFLMRADVAARNSNFRRYASSNAASLPMVLDEVKNDPGIFPLPEVKAKLAPDLPESAKFARQLTRSWTRFKTGR